MTTQKEKQVKVEEQNGRENNVIYNSRQGGYVRQPQPPFWVKTLEKRPLPKSTENMKAEYISECINCVAHHHKQ